MHHQKAFGLKSNAALLIAAIMATILAGCEQSSSTPSPTASRPTATPTATPSPTPSPAQYGVFAVLSNGTGGSISAFHSSDGSVLWHQPLEPGAVDPALADGALYTSSAQSSTTNLEAFRLHDGTPLWQAPVKAYINQIKTADGNVYTGSVGGEMDAFSAQDGKHLWAYTVAKCDSTRFTAGGGMIFVAPGNAYPGSGCDTRLIALRASDSSVLWHASISQPVSASFNAIVYANDTIYLNTQQAIYALHASDGSVVWQFPISAGSFGGAPIIVDGASLYTEIGLGKNIAVVALQTSNGHQLWSQTIQNVSNPPQFAEADGMVYIPVSTSQTSGYLQALSATNGTPTWTAQLAGGITHPTAGAGLVVIETWPGDPASTLPYALHAFHATDGSVAWTTQLTGGGYQPILAPLS